MKIFQNISLKPYHTFGTNVKAAKLIEIYRLKDIIKACNNIIKKGDKIFILGGGSNVLFIKDFDGVIFKIKSKGISIKKLTENYAYVKVAAGEIWHEFITWCMKQNFGGLENLSLIPGYVGTAPIQNIGAYGVEQKDCFVSLEAFNIKTKKIEIFKKATCEFSYRNSFFKNKGKGNYIILNVTYRLYRKNHQLHLDYRTIKSALVKKSLSTISIQDISTIVSKIRTCTLPDISVLGNAGSFFKNPEIEKSTFQKLLQKFPDIKWFPVAVENKIKISAAWLIEKAGWKGKRIGAAGVYKKHALVLVNYGKATGAEILKLAEEIEQDVFKKFCLKLEKEVIVI